MDKKIPIMKNTLPDLSSSLVVLARKFPIKKPKKSIPIPKIIFITPSSI